MATGILPGTGSAISMGKVNQAFSNYPPGTGGNANGTTSTGGGKNIKLSEVLGANYAGVSTGTVIRFSSTFGGKTTPFEYPP